MLHRGLARKVVVHLNEDTASNRTFAYEQVFTFLYDKGVAGATLIRPEEGFGSHHQRHDREGHGTSRRHLPVRIEFIETVELVETLLPELCELVQDGLIEMQDTTIVKAAKQEAPL
jgi:PII-like signaling protein